MKLKFVTLLATGLLATTACAFGAKEISWEDWKAKAAELGESDYTKATLKYSYTEKTPAGDDKEDHEFHYTLAEGVWTSEEEDAAYYTTALYMTAKAIAENISDEEAKDYKFYSDLSIKGSQKEEQTMDLSEYGSTGTITMSGSASAEYKFNSVGLMTSSVTTETVKITASSDVPQEFLDILKEYMGIEPGTFSYKEVVTISYSK